MKKLIAIALISLLLVPAALADADLSGYSYEDLTALYLQVQREIMSRPEWKEVVVPPGFWKVGVDIPAGDYSVELVDLEDDIILNIWGAAADDYTTDGGLLLCDDLYEEKPIYGKITLKDGNVLEISGAVIMAPVKGLGF